MATKWLLVSTFGGAVPSIVGQGRTPKPFVPLEQVIKSRRSFADATSAITEVMAHPTKIDRLSSDGLRRVIADPLCTFEGRLHAIYLWVGSAEEKVAQRDPAGAWYFNLTDFKVSGSDDLFDLYGVAPENRRSEAAMAGAFDRLDTGVDEGHALAKIVKSTPGMEHQAVWTVKRDDGARRAAHFSCRAVEERPDPNSDRKVVILRGVTHDIGPADDVPTAPPPVILEHRVLDAKLKPGEYLAYVDHKKLSLLKWRGNPMPGIAWEGGVGEPTPAMHPDDVEVARRLSADLARGSTSGVIRFRGLDGEWKPLHLEVSLMAFDQHTMGALVTVSAAP
ncbi:GAF domain-containing protein [Rhodococcus opacus]|jgi:hypothetical protein|uniref:Uncharacterized protein n=1 Tax=Rhodococcus opacus (strain B4) TaxID=632772 RepID=C1BE58_RHOOB|nr:GAF domain-containing protein [Rhodococcus opacus]UNN05275.1 DUF5593 domain-containing protein [Rhodococcus opacus]BAH56098.1 hypothetical protein ROP_pKNR-00060 [Rhodococcus opacus B4]